jgi:amino acid adenylation domain-containing protein
MIEQASAPPNRLSDQQRALLIAKLRQGRPSGPVIEIQPRSSVIQEIPASLGQRQLWIFDRSQPDAGATYNIPFAVHLQGKLDTDALRQSLDALVRRHESLRTRFLADADGQPVQVVDQEVTVELPLLLVEDEARWRSYADQQARLPFDLARDRMLRARLIELADDRHVLLLVIHHIAFDGWSIAILLGELAALYASYVDGEPARLAELTVQPADYALWEQRRLEDHLLDQQIEYWQAVLAGAPTLQLPTDRPRPPTGTFEGNVEWLNLGADLTAGIQRLSREHGTTVFAVLMAALQILLHRYTGQDDIVIGTASANRTRPELAPVIGYLVNLLPIRTDLSANPRFSDYLAQVHHTALDAYAHQDLPFAVMVERAGGSPDPSRAPIFQTVFSMVEAPEAVRAAGLLMEHEPIDLPATKFDLDFYGRLISGELRIELSFCTALFDRSTIQRMLGNLAVLLSGIIDAPDLRLSELPLLTAAELHDELVTFNDTALALPTGCLHGRFERQVLLGPDRIAIQFGTESMTYAALNARANQIARWIRKTGVQEGSLIGMSLPTSTDRVAVMLGILKAGCGYLPLDPTLPPKRLAFMIADASLALVIASSATSTELPVAGQMLHFLDREWREIEQLDDTDPRYRVPDSHLAYAIYTSGSTGQPKGVLIEHRQAVNFTESMIRVWSITPADRILQFASLNFDASVLEIFGALLSGARLVLGTRDELLSSKRLADLIRDTGVSVACLTPTVAGLLVTEPLPGLRMLLLAGEAVPAELARAWSRPGLRLVNGYGPTETTVCATHADLTSFAEPVPIGLPMPNYQAYVLDPALNPVPLGVVGELYIGGAGVARGYLERAELTEQRFIQDPFNGQAGSRLYKTGDLVKRRLDGQLVFVGRIDSQIKIRGLRIEPGEIEAALVAHPDVAQAIAAVASDAVGQPRLTAYVRPAGSSVGDLVDELSRHLRDWLPGYMVPNRILLCTEFPLNNSGKVDRSALLRMADDTPLKGFAAPRTEVERTLTGSYADLLGLGQVGIDDGFFELGGSSLQAMQLVSRIGTALGVTVGVTDILLAPSPRLLAARIEGSRGPRTGSPLVTLADGHQPIYLLHPVGGTVVGYLELARELAGRYRVIGIEAVADAGAGAPLDRLPELVANYFELIRHAQPHGPYRLAGWSMGGVLAYELAQRLERIGAEVACLALLDAPFAVPEMNQSEAATAAQFVADVAAIEGWDPAAAPGPARPAADHLAWLAEQAAASASSGIGLRTELERRFEIFRAHHRALSGYRAGGRVRANTVLIGAESSLNHDALPQWQELFDGPVSARYVAGDHYSFLHGAGAGEVAELISG